MKNKMEVKEVSLVSGTGLAKEERFGTSDPVMKIKEETALFNDSQMEIKQESLVSDICFQNEGFPSDAMKIKNITDVCGIAKKIEIKEEPWWQEGTTPEVTYQPEALFVSDLHVQNNIKDEVIDSFSAAKSTRLYTEAASNLSSATEAIFTNKDLKDKDIPEFGGANIHVVYESNVTESFCLEQSIHLHMSDALHEYKHSEKRNNCSDNSEKLLKCEICEKSFSQRKNLKVHSLIHEGIKPYKCNVCGKGYTQNGSLKTHILVHEGKKPYRCAICEKSFTQGGGLKRHILIHEGKKLYKCQICEKTFIQRGGLKRHILMHEGKRPFKCEVCKKSFTRKLSLDNHYLIHEGKSLYKCDVCEKSFTQLGDLKRHTLIHEGKRPYKCDVCERSFTQMGGLRRHKFIHEDKSTTQV